jgi:predicted lipoprotein
MSAPVISPTRRVSRRRLRMAVAGVVAVVLLAAMIANIKVVKIGSKESAQPGVFSPAAYGAEEFPKIQGAVDGKAVDAATLATALTQDQAGAVKQYGVATGAGPEFSIKFTGVAGKSDFGVYDMSVSGLPETVHLRVQTGPAIMGTDLRDATGTINFGQFTNQIEYQNAGSAINKEMKKEVLSKVDAANLTGKTLSVVGAFQLNDPGNWVVTPVKLEVK